MRRPRKSRERDTECVEEGEAGWAELAVPYPSLLATCVSFANFRTASQ
jgi:hypothetical protein